MTSTANNEFIATCLEIDALLATLTARRADHFDTDAEAVNWGDVGSAGFVRDKLAEAVSHYPS